MKTAGILFAMVCFVQLSWAQCTWTSVFYDSYEYTSVIPYIVPGTTYQNTSQTYAGCVRTGTRGMYLNIVDGFSGIVYSQPFQDICIGQNYRFTFSTRDAFSSTNNLTFNVYDNNSNALLATQTVVTNSIWNDVTMPSFTATSTTIRFEILSNTPGGPGNDAGFDDLRLQQCQPNPINHTVTKCIGTPNFNLYNEQAGVILSQSGIWTGPAALQNGYLGTFTTAVNPNGTYTYTIDGAIGCADSISNFQVQVISSPDITAFTAIEACQNTILPAITGTNITSNAAYFTGTNGTGTTYNPGASISTSQTLYAYDGIAGCSDQESVVVTISQPNTAGNDENISYCSPVGSIDLNLLLNGNTGQTGTWTETTIPASGTFTPANGAFNTSGIPFGTYSFTYTAPANGACIADQAVFTVSIGEQANVDLGNDTTFCQGQGMMLNPGVFDSYLWDNNSVNQTRYVTLPGTYWVKVGNIGDNIILNGDFEQGNTGFSTGYLPGSGGAFGLLSNAGTYAVSTSPNLVHNNFSACQDHTPTPGTNMLIVNGSGTPNTSVWCQTVDVLPNTDYQFSTWVSSALNDANVAQLQFNIDGANLGGIFSPSASGCSWSQFYQTWNSGMATNIQICIVNQNTNVSGNDFAIDDISFAPICYAYDTIVVGNYPQPVITVSPNDTICAGETAQLTASSAANNLTYTWNPGALTGNSISVSPLVSTVYTVSAVSTEGCTSNIVNRTVIVRPTPQADIFVNGNDTICIGATVLLDGTSSLPSSTFLWSPSNGVNQQEAVIPVANTTYSLTVTSPFGCSHDTSVTIFVIPDLNVDISGSTSFCEGSGTTLSVTSNQPNMEYHWFPTGETTPQVNLSSGNAGWIYVTGDYFFCPQAIDSVQLVVQPNPTVIVPQDVEVCPGEPVTMQVASDQPGSTFVWNPGNLSGEVNTLTVNATTVYYVFAQNGACISPLDSFAINVSSACYLAIPNVFTPNGDDSNDFFQLVSHEGIASLSCVIVNRWGNTIRTFNTPDFAWDGTDESGNTVSEGVYFYRIEAVTNAQEILNEHGTVTLVH